MKRPNAELVGGGDLFGPRVEVTNENGKSYIGRVYTGELTWRGANTVVVARPSNNALGFDLNVAHPEDVHYLDPEEQT